MQLKNKKEISCKALISLINASKKKNLDLNRLTEGVPYEVSYLLNKHERIEWEAACKIISNSRPFFSRSEYEQMGMDFVENEVYIEGVIFSFILFSSNKLNKILKSQILKGANSIVNPIFSCIHQQSYFIEKNKIGLYFYLDPGYEHCPEFFYMSIGVLEKLGSNKKGFKVDFSLTSNGGIYEVSWEEAGLIFKMNKWIRWLFNIRKAFLELTESH
ncbi:MAG TPA: hypothetical protein VLB50_05945, partial [Ignavibacteriaceae bacterium]|nr:hypothetical protein [Ignavibacteriaceae bacterium]